MASALRRRRALPSDTPSDSPTPRDGSPAPDTPGEPEDDEKITVIHQHKKARKRRTTAIFLLGSLFGIVVAGFFASSSDLINLPDIGELSMDSLFDVLPAGLVKDMRDLVVSGHTYPVKYSLAADFDPCRKANETSSKPTMLSLSASRPKPRECRLFTPLS